ncbi:hypothetical protein ABPG73_019022 [Tetrahymena malaccensis]
MKQNSFKKVGHYIIDTNNPLGSGNYGSVYRGSLYSDDRNIINGQMNTIYAIKETPLLSNNAADLSSKKKIAIREINNLKQLNHPHIIKFIDAKQTDKNIYLIMEFCNGGTLEKLIKEKKPNEKECLYYFSQIVSAFKYLIQEANMLHRDVKPENILIHNDMIKLADFGFSKEVMNDEYQFATIAGSPMFSAPQILRSHKYTSKAEIWSLGVTLYFMLCYENEKDKSCYPWQANSQVQLLKEIEKNKEIQFPESKNLSQKVKELIRKMLQINEEDRLNWEDLFNHELFKYECYNEPNLKESKKYEPINEIDANEEVCPDMTHIMNKNQSNKVIIERIEKYIVWQTNLAFFLFKTAKLFREIKQYVLPFFLDDQEIINKLMYVLCRKSSSIFNRLKLMFEQGIKNQYNRIQQHEWEIFKQNTEKYEIQKKKVDNNFATYKTNLENSYQSCKATSPKDDRIVNSLDIHQQLETEVIEKAIRHLYLGLESINQKISSPSSSGLSEDEQKLLFVLDDLFMIYAFEYSFNQKDNLKSKNIEKLYYIRKLVAPKTLFIRIVNAFKHNFQNLNTRH